MKDLQSEERVVADLPDHMLWFWLLPAIIRSFADAVELVAAFQITLVETHGRLLH
jgi:hypothetical protein